MKVIPMLLAAFTAAGPAGAYELSHVTTSAGAPAGVSGGLALRGSTAAESGPAGRVTGAGYTLGLGFWPGFFEASGATGIVAPALAASLPRSNSLLQNHPNPFGGATTIAYAVTSPAAVNLVIYDVSGRRVATLVERESAPGFFEARWNGADDRGANAASGIYFYRIRVGAWSATRRMLKIN